MMDFFVGPVSRRSWKKIDVRFREALKKKMVVYISLRQSSEWGMRALQGSFSRLKVRLTSNREYRTQIISLIVLLHNFRTTYVGLNQISTVFNTHYENSINIEGYDRISRYYDYFNE